MPEGENQVLNYTMVQYRLFPLLAATYALHFTGKNMLQMYQNHQNSPSEALPGVPTHNPDNASVEGTYDRDETLAQLHALSCALKALTSTIAGEGLETCRRACGGHGYSSFAGIGAWAADYLPTLTWEGDNYMLTQQVSRYLLKMARRVQMSGSSSGSGDAFQVLAEYTARQSKARGYDVLLDDSQILAAFQHRVGYQTFEVLRRRDVEKASWNSLLIDFWRLSTAYAQYTLVKNFHEALRDATLSSVGEDTVRVLHQLFQLHALHVLSQESPSFLNSGACDVGVLPHVEARVLNLLSEIRPHAINLVDAWKLPDWQLDSSLGRADGRVYEDLFHRASDLNPLNDITFDCNPNSPVLFREDHNLELQSKL
jgi:acyl-CoA oxidase